MKKILVAVDDSLHSRNAVEIVSQRAWPAMCEMRVVNVCSEKSSDALEAARQLVDKATKKLRERLPRTNVTGDVLQGNVKTALLEAADKWQADLIAVGSRGRKGISRVVLGSVSQTMLLHSVSSAFIARVSDMDERAVDLAPFLKNILLPVDNTPHSKAALNWMLNYEWSEGTNIKLVSMVQPLFDKYSDGISALSAMNLSEEKAETKDAAVLFLRASAKKVSAKFANVHVSSEVRVGDPATEILAIANQWPAGIIIMGTHGHGSVARFWLGSVSQEVVLNAPCPVEVVRAPD